MLTLSSIISSCEIAEALMQLVFNAVGSALGDSESLLARAVSRALRIGMTVPVKLMSMGTDPEEAMKELEALEAAHLDAVTQEAAAHAAGNRLDG